MRVRRDAAPQVLAFATVNHSAGTAAPDSSVANLPLSLRFSVLHKRSRHLAFLTATLFRYPRDERCLVFCHAGITHSSLSSALCSLNAAVASTYLCLPYDASMLRRAANAQR